MLRALSPVTSTALAAFLLLSIAEAMAEEIDAGQPIICAATGVTQCPEVGACVQGPASLFNLPVFFRINLRENLVETTREGGERRTSAIAKSEKRNDAILLQGADEETAWLATVQLASGKMTVIAVKEAEAFIVFGSCMAQ